MPSTEILLITSLTELFVYLFHLSILILMIVQRKTIFNGPFYNIFRSVLIADLICYVCMIITQRLPYIPELHNFYTTTLFFTTTVVDTLSYASTFQFLGHLFLAFNRFTLIWFPLKHENIWKKQWYICVIIILPLLSVSWRLHEPVTLIFSADKTTFYMAFLSNSATAINFPLSTSVYLITTLLAGIFNFLAFLKFVLFKHQNNNNNNGVNVNERTLLLVSFVIFISQILRLSYNLIYIFFKSNLEVMTFFNTILPYLYDIFAWSGSISLMVLSSSTRQAYKSFYFSKNSAIPYYIPKDATEQELFLLKYPNFDGRGIKIGIIDSGLDVSLDGLQHTSEGHPKIIDCFDFTGIGDVDTTVTTNMNSENNNLIGLSGKKLKIPSKWRNPSGKWHLGLKSLFKPNKVKTFEKLPEMDCIVWYDGIKWLACIDTFDDEGNLENKKVLTNFCDNHEYGILCFDGFKMSYCITVHNNGNLLEIFTPYDHHGSVVAQIASAYFPKNPERNGLAPGAQILFMSVLDPRMGYFLDSKNLEALKKALLKCIEIKVDIVNYSIAGFYGNKDIAYLINEMVHKHNILFIRSVTNYGPFYATISQNDHDVEDVVFSVGAVITTEIRKNIYSITVDDDNPPPPVVYPLSSRGPGATGSWGLDFVAPGAAIVTMPTFTSEIIGGFEGTSFSSPNAAGAIACLLSGLKANSIQFSPFSIKFSFFKTANLPKNGNKFEFGHGVIQIYNAFNYHKNNNYERILGLHKTKKNGIDFLLNNVDHHQTIIKRNLDLSCFIENLSAEAATKLTLKISPKIAEQFISLLSSKIDKNNSFTVKIVTEKLEEGSFNFAEILVIDPLNGSICSIPINVVYVLKIIETANYRIQKEITLTYENPRHLFLNPSFKTSKKCKIQITAIENLNTKLCIQYLAQNDNLLNSRNNIKEFEFFTKNQTVTFLFPVKNEVTHEICIYQKIGGLPNAIFKIEIEFQNEEKK